MKVNEQQPHYFGHRERLRNRFEKNKFHGFHDYEVVELLLTFVIPRKDVKQIAKTLLKKYHSLPEILKADTQELASIDGLGKQSAMFLSFLHEFIMYFHKELGRTNTIVFTNLQELVTYFKGTIGLKKVETVEVLYLNNKNECLLNAELSEGTVTEVIAFPRTILEQALSLHSSAVILGHNHPGGETKPSKSDDRLTISIKRALETVNISLIDHIIINEKPNEYFSYKQQGYL